MRKSKGQVCTICGGQLSNGPVKIGNFVVWVHGQDEHEGRCLHDHISKLRATSGIKPSSLPIQLLTHKNTVQTIVNKHIELSIKQNWTEAKKSRAHQDSLIKQLIACWELSMLIGVGVAPKISDIMEKLGIQNNNARGQFVKLYKNSLKALGDIAA